MPVRTTSSACSPSARAHFSVFRWKTRALLQRALDNLQKCARLFDMYSLKVTSYNRSQGHSATAAAAYRAGVRIEDQRTGTVHDYRRKKGVVTSLLLGYAGTREELWNAVEKHAPRANSQIAREVRLALPHEISDEARLSVVAKLASWLRDQYQVAVDAAIHRPARGGDERNDHAHLLLTPFTVQGDQMGDKIAILNDRATSQAEIEKIRAKASELIQAVVQDKAAWDHRSFKERGIDRIPTLHRGKAATYLERRTGILTEIGAKNSAIKEINALKVQQRRATRTMTLIELFRQEYSAYKAKSESGEFPKDLNFHDWLDLYQHGNEPLLKLYNQLAEAEEESLKKEKARWEAQKAQEARIKAQEAYATTIRQRNAFHDYLQILTTARHSRSLKELYERSMRERVAGNIAEADRIIFEGFWNKKLAEYPGRSTVEIARADIQRIDDVRAGKPATPGAYPAGYRTAQEIRDQKQAGKHTGRGTP